MAGVDAERGERLLGGRRRPRGRAGPSQVEPRRRLLVDPAGFRPLLSQPGELSSQDYLRIQQYMQAEAQQFTAVSNILKVRSDSAKAAINNIR